jgi:hypothetical protein
MPEPQRERGEQDDEDQLDAERILVPRRCGEPRERVASCVEDPPQPGLALIGAFCLRVFRLRVFL